jgi:hypothetical protein
MMPSNGPRIFRGPLPLLDLMSSRPEWKAFRQCGWLPQGGSSTGSAKVNDRPRVSLTAWTALRSRTSGMIEGRWRRIDPS